MFDVLTSGFWSTGPRVISCASRVGVTATGLTYAGAGNHVIEKIIELASRWWEMLLPWEVVDAYEAGVVLRFGVYHRTVGPGFNWKWPLAERVLTARTCATTVRLPTYTLVTRDGRVIAVGAMVKYQIRDVRKFLLEIWDSVDVLADVTLGAIKRTVNASTYAELHNPDIDSEARVVELVRNEVNRYGFQIMRITFVELAPTRALRFINDSLTSSAGNVDN